MDMREDVRGQNSKGWKTENGLEDRLDTEWDRRGQETG